MALPAPTTPYAILRLAFKDAGILGQGQEVSNEDIQDGLLRMNFMIAQWQMKRYLVYHLVDKSVVSTGALNYTVGPTVAAPPQPDIIMAYRPDRIEYAYIRQLVNDGNNFPVDYPLEILQSREDYARVQVKNLGTFPMFAFYDPALPNGLLYPWPLPEANLYEVHVLFKEALPGFPDLTTAILLPDAYMAALHFNMAVRLGAAYKIPVTDDMKGMARESLSIIRGANAAIPALVMPSGLNRGGIYNVLSDQVY